MIEIGRHKYNHLKSLKELSPEHKAQIEKYESKKFKTNNNQVGKEYCEKVNRLIQNGDDDRNLIINSRMLLVRFNDIFKKRNGFQPNYTEEYLEGLNTIISYMTREPEFFKSKLLMNKEKSSFDKGLLIIGDYGCGKSELMECLRLSLMFPNYSFKSSSSNEIVQEYTENSQGYGREKIMNYVGKGTVYFDDLTTEELAFGKTDVLKQILEERERKGLKTFASMNFKEGFVGDIDQAKQMYSERYGLRLADRIPTMFNIIHFKGSSFRQ